MSNKSNPPVEVKDLSGKKETPTPDLKKEDDGQDLTKQDGDAKVIPPEAVKPDIAADLALEPSLADPAAPVGKDEIITGAGTAVTAIAKQRITRHFDFLCGRLSIPEKKARDREQVDFMNLVGETLKLPYPQFELIAEALREAITDDMKILKDGGVAFRFIPRLDVAYPGEALDAYQRYFQFLLTLSKNWKRRRDIGKLTDITSVIEGFPTKGRENVTAYYRKLTAA